MVASKLCGVFLNILDQVTVFLFLPARFSFTYVTGKIGQTIKGVREFTGEHPAFMVAMLFVEPRDVIDQAQAAHLGSDCLKDTSAEAVLVRHPFQGGQKLVIGPLEFDEYSQTYLLLILIAGEKNPCQLVQILNPGDSVVADLNFCADHFCSAIYRESMDCS